MADGEDTPLVTILNYCAAAAPEPWYPSAFAREKGIPRDSLDPPLDRLRLGGLVQLTDWVQGTGQGYRLTPEGERVLQTPRDMALLRQGRLPEAGIKADEELGSPHPGSTTTWDRGETIRAALLDAQPPRVTHVLILTNVAVFMVGMALAGTQNLTSEYISGFGGGKLWEIQHSLGALTGIDIVQGKWWKLLTSCFVHFGLLHLFVNMYTLYALGPMVEQMWGRWRFLLIYLIAGLGGGCAFLWNNPETRGAGASGAIWGVLTSYVAWIFLNRRYLPGPISPAWMRNLMSVFLINIFISMMPYVSAAAHFGGGAVGVVAAWLVNTQRFASGPVKWVAAAGIVLLPVVCVGVLYRDVQTDVRWGPAVRRALNQQAALEGDWFHKELRPQMRGTMPAAEKVFREQVQPITDQRPDRRNQEKVQAAAEAVAAQSAQLQKLGQWLESQGPFTDKRVDEAWRTAKEYVTVSTDLFRQAQLALRGGVDWKKEDAALAAQQQRFEQARKAWNSWD